MNETKKKSATAPVKTIRHGAIAASIWKRQATSGFEYFDFTVSRSWKTSATGKEGYSTSFFARNAEDLHAAPRHPGDGACAEDYAASSTQRGRYNEGADADRNGSVVACG